MQLEWHLENPIIFGWVYQFRVTVSGWEIQK